jgi:hypothetical protein
VYNADTMLEVSFFALGIINSLFLTGIFLIRMNRLDILQRIGWSYFLLAIPAGYEVGLTLQEGKSIRYIIFLVIFLAFLFLEWLLDYALKIDFRANMKKHLKWAVPYLALYYAMNYGFVVMPWKTSLVWGIIMLGLFAVQIIANLAGHPRNTTWTIRQYACVCAAS